MTLLIQLYHVVASECCIPKESSLNSWFYRFSRTIEMGRDELEEAQLLNSELWRMTSSSCLCDGAWPHVIETT